MTVRCRDNNLLLLLNRKVYKRTVYVCGAAAQWQKTVSRGTQQHSLSQEIPKTFCLTHHTQTMQHNKIKDNVTSPQLFKHSFHLFWIYYLYFL